jgi:tRNA threonylcarbamoyladenosine biosynthesis protein TsaE
MTKTFLLMSVDQWKEVVAWVAPQLQSGDVVTLEGDLGAGKTTMVQALVKALGSDAVVTSPTFALRQVYPLSFGELKRCVHIDGYRLETAKDAHVLGLEEDMGIPGTMFCVEWPENIRPWIGTHRIWNVSIKHLSGDAREVTIMRTPLSQVS